MTTDKQRVLDTLQAVENELYDVRTKLSDITITPDTARPLLEIYDMLVKAEGKLIEALDSRWWD